MWWVMLLGEETIWEDKELWHSQSSENLITTRTIWGKFWYCWSWFLVKSDSCQASVLGTLCSWTVAQLVPAELWRCRQRSRHGSWGSWEQVSLQVTQCPGFCSLCRQSSGGPGREPRHGSQTRGARMLLTHLGERNFADKARQLAHATRVLPRVGPGRRYTASQFVFGCNVHAHMQIATSPPSTPQSPRKQLREGEEKKKRRGREKERRKRREKGKRTEGGKRRGR